MHIHETYKVPEDDGVIVNKLAAVQHVLTVLLH